MAAPSAGGALLPFQDQRFRGNVQIDGNLTVLGTETSTGDTFTNPTLASPTITGTTTASGTAAVTYTAGSWSLQQTLTAASYAPSTHADEVYSKITLTPTSTVTAANGLNTIRGEVNITAAKTLGDGTASYVTGVYGRVNFNTATINIGSGDLAAVYAKFDMGSTSTLTSGHIAPLQSNIVNPPSGAGTTTDLIYAESASGTAIKSILSGFAAANFAFDLTDVGAVMFPAISSTTLDGLNIKVKLNGSTYYIKTGTAA